MTGDPSSAPAPRDEPARGARPWRARLARLLLLVGAALAASQLLPPLLAQRQRLSFDIAKKAPAPTRLGFTWQCEDDPTLHGGVTLAVPSAQARSVEHSLDVPDGDYRLQVWVQQEDHDGRPIETRYLRRVTLDGSRTTIRLDGPP